jgi:hypothetical protein
MWTAALAPLNKWWTKLGVLLYRAVSPIVLGLLFYVAVMPVGLLMRVLVGKSAATAATPMPRVTTERRRGPRLNP